MNSLKIFIFLVNILLAYSAKNKFDDCKFKWGRNWAGDNVNYDHYDYITFWIGQIKSGCNNQASCTDFDPNKEGAYLKTIKRTGKIPVMYAYIIAFEGKNKGFRDCNDGHPNLCEKGANLIRQNRQHIIDRYSMHAQKVAEYLGKDTVAVFLIEPDFYQYYHTDHKQEGGTLSGKEMRALYDEFGKAIKSHLPNALISWDISPWANLNTWWSFFKDSQYVDLIHTSGGQHHAESEKIDGHSAGTWAGLHKLTGRKIISDTGYGVIGKPATYYNDAWYKNANVNARVKDGVIANTLANSNKDPTYKPATC